MNTKFLKKSAAVFFAAVFACAAFADKARSNDRDIVPMYFIVFGFWFS